MLPTIPVLARRFALVAAVATAVVAADLSAQQSAPAAGSQDQKPATPATSTGTGAGQDGRQREARDGAQGGGQDGQVRQRGGGGFGRGFGLGGGGGGGGGGGPGGGGMRDIREQLEPDFMRRDVPIFLRQLTLTDAQIPILETLMKDYEEEYQKESEVAQTDLQEMGQKLFSNMVTPAMREQFTSQMQTIQEDLRKLAEEKGGPIDEEARRAFFRERMMKMQEQMAQERKGTGADTELKKSLGEMFDKLTVWQTKKTEMRAHFVDGLKVSLGDDQLAHWPAFERFLNREKTLPRGRLSGEGTNLIFVLDEQKLAPEDFAKVESTLDPYELKLDAALVARNDYLASSTTKLFKALQEGDVKECTRIFDRQMQLRAVVRDVNEEFRVQMVSALGDGDTAKKFAKAALVDGYDRVFRATTTERSFDKALELESLDPAVRQGITDLRGAYLAELSGRNNDLLGTVKKNEPGQQATEAGRFATFMAAAMTGDFSSLGGAGMPFGGFGGGGRGDGAEDPVRKAFDSRTKFNDEYLVKLKEILTPEQIAELPQRQGRGGGAGGGGMTRMLEALPEAQRAEIMKKVDKNSNGQIDDDERGEFFRTMRDSGAEIFGAGGGPGGGGGGGAGRGGAQ